MNNNKINFVILKVFSGNLSCSICQTVTATPDSTTIYYVTVTGSNGCTGSDYVVVTVEVPFSIYIPNAFTPNNDLRNNIFYVYGVNITGFRCASTTGGAK